MTDFWPSLFKRGSSGTGPEAEEIKALSEQFRVTLRASASKVLVTEETRKILERAEALLESTDWNWKSAYEVEQQLVLLHDAETLRTELSRRTLEAQHVLYADAAAWYRERVKEVDTVSPQRALLLRLVNDLQWRYTVNEAKLGYVKQITGRTGWIFIIAMVVFVGFLLLLFESSQGEAIWFPERGRFLTFLLAAVSGFLGASFSMVSSLKARLEASGLNELKNASSKAVLFSRVLVGTGAAMILYFFFESQLLAGEAFPKLVDASGELDRSAGVRALLIVWCFIAGFSEKLVPGLLAKTEAKVSADDAQTMTHVSESTKPPPEPATVEAPRAADSAATTPADVDGGSPGKAESDGVDVDPPEPRKT